MERGGDLIDCRQGRVQTFEIYLSKVKLEKLVQNRGMEFGYLSIKLQSRIMGVNGHIRGEFGGLRKTMDRKVKDNMMKSFILVVCGKVKLEYGTGVHEIR